MGGGQKNKKKYKEYDKTKIIFFLRYCKKFARIIIIYCY